MPYIRNLKSISAWSQTRKFSPLGFARYYGNGIDEQDAALALARGLRGGGK